MGIPTSRARIAVTVMVFMVPPGLLHRNEELLIKDAAECDGEPRLYIHLLEEDHFMVLLLLLRQLRKLVLLLHVPVLAVKVLPSGIPPL